MTVQRRTDPHAGLLRQIGHRFMSDGEPPMLVESRSEPWMSATFAGARHSYRFRRVAGQKAILKRVREEIVEAEFDLPDHIVADIVIEDWAEDAACFVVEALTVEMD